MSEEIKYNRCKPYQLVLFPMNEGVQNLFMVVMMFASYVAAGGYGIAVATAGLIVTGTRILDGFTDPILACAKPLPVRPLFSRGRMYDFYHVYHAMELKRHFGVI